MTCAGAVRARVRALACSVAELGSAHRWFARAVILIFAGLTGAAVSGFSWFAGLGAHGFDSARASTTWVPLVLTPVAAALIAWVTRRYAAGTAGSGIPQVLAAIDPRVEREDRGTFVSIRLAAMKVLMTTGGIFAGLSLGREGPSAQVGAAVMHHARRWVPKSRSFSDEDLLVAGAAAGVAAAFGTPLGGIVFAVEQLCGRDRPWPKALIIVCGAFAGLVSIALCGHSWRASPIPTAGVGSAALVAALLVAAMCGIGGGCLARLVVASLKDGSSRFGILRARHPVVVAGFCGLLIAAVGVLSSGATFGGGESHTHRLLEDGRNPSPFYVPLKLIATWLTALTGVPGGLFTPSLAIGAGLGGDVAQWFRLPAPGALIACGMAASLAGLTQAPLAAAVIVMEMVGGQSILIHLLGCATIASAIAGRFGPPLYSALAEAQIGRLGERAAPQSV